MMKTITWMRQPMHQQVFPMTIAEGQLAISMSCMMSEHQNHQFPMETIQSTDGEAQPISSGTNEDEDGGTHASSPSVSFIGRRRRHSQGWCRVWTPLPHFPGLGHGMNPIPYPPQLYVTDHRRSSAPACRLRDLGELRLPPKGAVLSLTLLLVQCL